MGTHDGHRARKKAQFRVHGLDSFADHEALELLLFYAIPRQDTNPIAHALLDHFGSLEQVLSAPVEELQRVNGVGESTALLIRLIPQLLRRARISSANNERMLDTVDRIGQFFVDHFVAQTEEHMYQLCLDAKGRMLGCTLLATGDTASVSVNIRKVVEIALRQNAVLVALAHNHPSGIPFPSPQDRTVTLQVKEALDTVDIQLVDHIIVADDDFISMRQSGMIPR